MRLKKKCVFMGPEVEYLGHRINKEGLQPTEEKVRAITGAPQPTQVSELRAFLGLINYYGKFMPDLSTILAPLYQLLQKGRKWGWEKEQQEAFAKAKALLKSPKLLVHYDINKELILTCDASPVGLGAVLSHRMEDGRAPDSLCFKNPGPSREEVCPHRQGGTGHSVWGKAVPPVFAWTKVPPLHGS